MLIGPLGTNFSEILIKIETFSFRKIHLKMSSGKWRPFCLSLSVFKQMLSNQPGNGPPSPDEGRSSTLSSDHRILMEVAFNFMHRYKFAITTEHEPVQDLP